MVVVHGIPYGDVVVDVWFVCENSIVFAEYERGKHNSVKGSTLEHS